eukprot:gene4171-14271_t
MQSLWGFGYKSVKERTIEVYKGLRGEVDQMKRANRVVAWKLVRPPTIKDVQILNGCIAKPVVNKEYTSKLHFAQWTVSIASEQTFAVYERVVDHWVMERQVFKSWFLPRVGPNGAEWRLLARLHVTDPPPREKGEFDEPDAPEGVKKK